MERERCIILFGIDNKKGYNNCCKIVVSFLHLIYRTKAQILNRENKISQKFFLVSIFKGCSDLRHKAWSAEE